MPKNKKKEEAPVEMEVGGLPNMEGLQDMVGKLLQPTTLKEDTDLFKLEQFRHENRMLEIKTETDARREIATMKFNHQMQLQRIKTAEIKKSMDRKAGIEFLRKQG